MSESNCTLSGHSVQALVRAIEEDSVVPYKRQKSERTVTAERLGNGLRLSVGVEEDEPALRRQSKECPLMAVGDFVEDLMWYMAPNTLKSQIGAESSEEEEVIENNIMIQHPDRGAEGIPLGVHLRRHERGYRVHRMMREDLRQNNALREDDIIKVVGNTDVTSLPIERVKELFWNLDFNLTITLVVLRRPEDETDTDEGDQEYKVITTTLHLKKEDADIKFTANVDVHTGRGFRTFEPSATNSYFSVKEGGDQKYLCVQDGVPKMMQIVEESERSNFYWRTQLTLGDDLVSRFIMFHNNTRHTLCCDLDPSQDVSLVKMSTRGFLHVGSSTEADDRWILKDPTEGEPTNRVFYMECDQHRSFYLSVDGDGRLRYAREAAAQPRKFYFNEV